MWTLAVVWSLLGGAAPAHEPVRAPVTAGGAPAAAAGLRAPASDVASALAPDVADAPARDAASAAAPVVTSGRPAQEGVTVVATTVDGSGRPSFHAFTADTLEQAQRRAAEVSGAIAVEVDPVVTIAAGDPLSATQWSHTTLGVAALPAGGDGVVVAVVDSGVAAGHEDLSGQVLCGQGIDLVRDGASTDGCADPNGHGTHVTGILAASKDNGLGVAGLAPAVKVLPVRALDSLGSGYASDVAEGIRHAVDQGADVINLSLSGDLSSAQQAAVDYAVSRDVVLVAAAGNNRTQGNAVQYPAAFPAVLSVAATDTSDVSASFSTSGPTVDVAAPGVRISSTVPGGYAYNSGTSMAAPAVAALAARYRSARPAATQAEVVAALTTWARDLEAPGRDDNTGAGLVDLAAALAAGAPPAAPAPPPAPGASPADARVSLTWDGVPSSAAAPVSGYRLYRDGVLVAETAELGHVDTGLANGTTYAYTVAAYGDGGESAPSAATSATPVARPAGPTGLQAVPGDRTVALAWQAPAVTGGPRLGYHVYRDGVRQASTTATRWSDAEVVNRTAYAYSVRAYGAVEESAPGEVVVATPLSPPAPVTGVAPAPAPAPAPVAAPAPATTTSPSPTPRPDREPATTRPAPTTPVPVPDPPAQDDPPPARGPQEPETAPPGLEFPDALGSVHADAIAKVARAGITTGYPDGTFRPDDHVSRAQMATFLARALGLAPVPGTRFPDAAGSAHEGSINAVAAAGITVGDGHGRFAPAAPVTRGQLATFLTRALGLPPASGVAFSDVAGHAHEQSIGAVAAVGIAHGDSAGRFVPEGRVTRAQMATFLVRALGL